jgi:predicted pyridoxine 5'-phosphate oxidase superfamily flavin-nucleotide-binding protein
VTEPDHRFGSSGERMLQQHHGTVERAAAFYDRQVHPYLTPAMHAFIARMSMVFLSTADSRGACDASFRAGPPGFVQVLTDRTLTYPEYRGNGVMASAGNITENPHLGMLFMDFTRDHVGLHVNGTAALYPDAQLRGHYPDLPVDPAPGRRPELWVHVTVDEAYIHCSKHIPHLEPAVRPRDPESTRPRDQEYFTMPRVPLQAFPADHAPAPEHTRSPLRVRR